MHLIATARLLRAISDRGLEGPLFRLLRWLKLCAARRSERLTLRCLTDRQLKDVGLSRADVARECDRWPWEGADRFW